ncbi:MAG: ABC transporter permease [Acholeplasmataceae bacterium]
MTIELEIIRVIIAYVFVLGLFFALRMRGIGRERLLIIAMIRMTVQLILIGYLLIYIFDHPHPLWTLFVILLMILFAIHTVLKKFPGQLSPKLKRVIATSLPLCGLPILIFFLLVVIGIEPYFDPQYVIPIAGMIIGNSMTGISLGLNTMIKGMRVEREAIEAHLLLGATPRQATKDLIDHAFDNAITPTINSMLGMGIIFLPGMMTGQILAGVVPTMAIQYQIVIMLGILSSVSATTFIALKFGMLTFFRNDMLLDDGKQDRIANDGP